MKYSYELEAGKKVKLASLPTAAPDSITKEKAQELFAGFAEQIGSLQEQLYAAGQHRVLIVLQGMDTSGKDGTIRNVLRDVNPLGCRVESFKVPTETELRHDFLWRVHKATPERGMIGVFNRSHYEDVLVVRVHDLAPKKVWSKRYDQINDFERMLCETNTIVLKFFLHISKQEQEQRLLEREQDVTKAWKLSAGDWRERQHWDAYQDAYQDALARCTTDDAPWYVIPADNKWYRNLAVAEAIVTRLKGFQSKWNKTLDQISQEKKAELAAYRAEQSTP